MMDVFLAVVGLLGWVALIAWLAASLFPRDTVPRLISQAAFRFVPSVMIAMAIVAGVSGNLGWMEITSLLLLAVALPWDRNWGK